MATKQNTKTGDAIWSLANNGLDFLDSRTEFWRQQKPIYARKAHYRQSGGSSDANIPIDYIVKQLESIDNRKPLLLSEHQTSRRLIERAFCFASAIEWQIHRGVGQVLFFSALTG